MRCRFCFLAYDPTTARSYCPACEQPYAQSSPDRRAVTEALQTAEPGSLAHELARVAAAMLDRTPEPQPAEGTLARMIREDHDRQQTIRARLQQLLAACETATAACETATPGTPEAHAADRAYTSAHAAYSAFIGQHLPRSHWDRIGED